ncbi:MAG TPA: GNAT family protein [Thermomicrobiales bacterium]|nr:GNAT family protein [Thermomicrobiales bacterium]
MEHTSGSSPTLNIIGERVALGPFTRDLLEIDLRWINDLETQRNLGHIPRPRTIEQQTQYHERATTSSTDVIFTIYERETLRPIGTTGLHHIEHHHRSADFGILIGERAARGKGYGTEAARLMLDFAFTALGLHNVKLEVLEFNVAGIRAYEQAGFREIGRRTRCAFASGRYWDMVYMECLSTEFTSPVLADVFTPDAPR